MKTLLRFAVFVVAVSATALVGADVQLPVAGNPPLSETPSVAGDFIGTWRNDTEGGKLRLLLKQNGATWTAEASFTFQESEIPAKVRVSKWMARRSKSFWRGPFKKAPEQAG